MKPLREHTCNLKEKNGITMVALVVTIVVLLILASISIQGITRTGIFRAAEDTKLEHKRAAIATTLQTKLKINQTEQIRGTDEEIVKATYEDVKNDLEEIKKAGGKDIEVSEVTSEEKDGKTCQQVGHSLAVQRHVLISDVEDGFHFIVVQCRVV